MRMRKLRGPHMKKSMPFENFRTHTQPVNLADLEERFDAGAEVTPETLRGDGAFAKRRHPVKILGRGEITKKLTVTRTPSAPPPRRRSRRPAVPARLWSRNASELLRTPSASPDIRKKPPFTAAMLALYRLGAFIPAPGINVNAVKDIESNFGGSNILGFLNLFSGGSLSRLSLFALGIMPYITASIILQLLTVVVPSLERLQKEGEVGQQKITQYTRYLTVGLAFAQSIGYVFLFRSLPEPGGTSVVGQLTFAKVFLIVICLTAGCMLLMWLGELITQRGIGNGISLMIFASIASRIPNGITKRGGPTRTRSSS